MNDSNKKYYQTLFLILILLTAYSLPLNATIRYVSKTGNSTPPYTSWETAADSIQKCINISVFGDTIYVANGVYKEQVFMIPGLTLVGSGADSCFIDTRQFSTPTNFDAVEVVDDCYLEGFCILVSYWVSGQEYGGRGIGIYGNGIIEVINNKVKYANSGIGTANSSSIIRNNFITDIDIWGITLSGSVGPFNSVIENNIIYSNEWDVWISFAAGNNPTIVNNIIFIEGDSFSSGGIAGTYSGDRIVKNNLIIINSIGNTTSGIGLWDVPTLIDNNYIKGLQDVGIIGNNNVKIRNNVVKDGKNGIETVPGSPALIQYNDSWNNEFNYVGFTPDSTNLSADPMVVNEDSLDFHLQMFSPLIDAGDPSILDIDGSRSDIGLFGGPYGEIYTYRDLAPKPPKNLTAEYDSGLVKLTWDKNTEADFYGYRIYKDTVSNFMYDTTKLIAVTADTFYYDDLPEKYIATDYYYKLTAIDSTGHQSAASEEVQVIITGAPEGPPVVVEEYKLLNNYPNPFNPRTTIPYRLKEGGYVKLIIYGITGEIVTYLVNEYQPAGYHEAVFEPTARQREMGKFGDEFATGYNDDIASGIYLYQIIVRGAGDIPVFSDSGKMILLK